MEDFSTPSDENKSFIFRIKDLEDLERLRNKKLFLSEPTEAVDEMKQIKEGNVQARNAEDFLNEL